MIFHGQNTSVTVTGATMSAEGGNERGDKK